MLIKKIILNNIRSYEFQELEFPIGSTLLAGDIGSGKTSVLLAIEFALFGLQPGQKGAALLRNGKEEGSVILELEIGEKQIVLERTLKRKKSVNQDYCTITIDGEKREITITDLKNLVLELLNYPREFSKKQNILYKFTVYTPQEEMKQIILQDPETRINTLRHVFGIDKYKRILENTDILTTKLREERKLKEGMILNLEQDKMNLMEKEEELETKRHNLISVEKELFLKQEARKKTQEEQQDIIKKIDEKNRFQQEIEKTGIVIANKTDLKLNNKKTAEELKLQIKELEKLKFDESTIKKIENEIAVLKIEEQKLNDKNLDISSRINSLILKNKENENVKFKISKIEICPTCLQDVDPLYKTNVINQMDSNITENIKQVNQLTVEKKDISSKIDKILFDLNEKQKQLQELKITKIRLQELIDKQSKLNEIEKINVSLEKDIELLEQHLKLLQQSLFELKKFDRLFEEKQKQLENAMNEERLAEIKVAELKKEITFFSGQIEELAEKIRKTEEIKEQLNYLSELEDWLSKKFTSLIFFIEKKVMIKLKSNFSELFAEWFLMLVSEDFNVNLDDNFTPIIEQQDYELDYSCLSGGERTAVALAYRLALNQVINSILSKIKTRDLVILDEPTDGFSDTQLDKMRDVLQELNVKQLIIVSHEQKIEGFVENVIRFKKEAGISHLEEITSEKIEN